MVTQSHVKQADIKPSLSRWLRHTAAIPGKSKRLFDQAARQTMTDAVKQAEIGHAGEVQVVIEECLPSHLAYRQNTCQRARQLFQELAVWDTHYRSGVLLYVNLCEHQIEVVADRGIHAAVSPDHWLKVVDEVRVRFQQKRYAEGICAGVQVIGDTLRQFYTDKTPNDQGNEKRDAPIFL